MKKSPFLIILCIFSLLFLSSCWVFEKTNNQEIETNPEQTSTGKIAPVKEKPKTQKEIGQEIVQQKINNLKKKLALRWLVVKWDIYFNNDQATLALKQYLDVYKETPDDQALIKKIWDSYFKIHKYNSAYSYYSKIKDYSELNKNRAILSYIYTKDVMSLQDRQDILSEMYSFGFSEDEQFYYATSFICLDDFHGCKIAFQEYIERERPIGEDGQAIEENRYIQEISTAVENYRAFQVDEIYYKDALIIWAFYTNGLYPIAIELWNKLLEEKTDYLPMFKIIGKSYFDMGKYKESKEFLSQYYNIDKTDAGVTYLLWVLNSRLHEYVLSNIYLGKALESNYKPSIDARRKLIYNYFLLENTERILLNFKELVEKEEVLDQEDLQMAIYYHITHERYEDAIVFSNKWLELFPEQEIFYGYLGWIYKLQNQNEKAEEKLQAGLAIDGKNPMLNLNMWLIQKEKWEKVKALLYFRKAVKENKDWEFGVVAAEELEKFKQENNIQESEPLQTEVRE